MDFPPKLFNESNLTDSQTFWSSLMAPPVNHGKFKIHPFHFLSRSPLHFIRAQLRESQGIALQVASMVNHSQG